MIILISPAKSMDNSVGYNIENSTTPRFLNEAEELVAMMKNLSVDDITRIFKVSPTLALSTFQRYQNFGTSKTNPALLSYTGTVFKEIRPKDFTHEEMIFAQQHLRILSVLYGLLRPLDLIKEYRLEYKLKLEGLNLYAFWKKLLTEMLITDTIASGGVLLNLGSLDLLPALDMQLLRSKVHVVSVEFKTFKNGKFTNIQTYSKIARGMLTNFIIKGQLSDIEEIKMFDRGGYTFNAELSCNGNIVFTK